MTDDAVSRAFREHPAFEAAGEAEYEVTTTPFENTTVASEDGYRVAVRTPTLDAAVEGEAVADVVADGWFETLELRLEDVHTVTETDAADPPEIDRGGDEVVVTVEFARDDPAGAAEDAKAVVDYVEGTWVQGIIPGYDYGDPATTLLERATQNYDEDTENGPSGAPPL